MGRLRKAVEGDCPMMKTPIVSDPAERGSAPIQPTQRCRPRRLPIQRQVPTRVRTYLTRDRFLSSVTPSRLTFQMPRTSLMPPPSGSISSVVSPFHQYTRSLFTRACAPKIHRTVTRHFLRSPAALSTTSVATHLIPPLPRSTSPAAITRRSYLTDSLRAHQARKMAPQVDGFFKQVDSLSDHFIDRLRRAVAIPSISSDASRRPDVFRMGHFLADELKALGAQVELRPLGKQPDNPALDLPPVILARYGSDKNKRTILVYGHYDVQPAEKSDGWATQPFDLTLDSSGRMFGRGSTDDKGPVLGWLNAIEAHQKAGVDFPVNLLMCFEGMEEYGSEGLDALIEAEGKKYFADADAVCISDNYWLGTEKPCLTYGLRGCNYYSVEVSGPGQDLHSGVFGGTAQEPMTDLVRLLGTLVDTNGKILIPGINEQVAAVTESEESLYDGISFTMETLHDSLGSKTTIFEDKKPTLMARWRYPSLSVHGVEGAFSAPGAKTVIPAKVIGKFSIRTVPDMEIDKTNELVYKYVQEQFAKLGSKNTMKVYAQHTGKWWVASPNHWNFSAAAKAVERVWGVKPDFTREGGR